MLKKLVFSLILLFWLFTLNTSADYDSYVNVESLNVRLSNSTNSKVVAIVTKWLKLSVLEDLKSWWKKVMLSNWKIWYINWKYVSIESPKRIEWTKYSVTSNNVFLRWLDLNKKVAILNKWDELEVLNDMLFKDNWMHVKVISSKNEKYISREGYISKKFVEKIVSEELEEESYDDSYIVDDYSNYTDYSENSEYYDDYFDDSYDYSQDYYDTWFLDMPADTELIVKKLSEWDLSILKSDTFAEWSSLASVTIYNILDTECPACKSVHDYEIIQDLVKKSNWNINSVYIPYPLDYHENALDEAKAIYCAWNLWGQDTYNNYVSWILSESDWTAWTWFPKSGLVPLAKKLWLNEDDFNKCIKDESITEKIQSKSNSIGETFSIDSIPTIVILNNKTNEYVKLDLSMINYYSELTQKIIDWIFKVYPKK
jgi:protein-disulfide isomerase